MIKEWNLIRTLACLSIVMLHSTTTVGRAVDFDGFESFNFMRMLLLYATPMFVVLSEVILSNRYNKSIPDDFFRKRIKYILGPYLTFAVINAFVYNHLSANENYSVLKKLWSSLLGNYEGYFILIIFQFYLLHYVVIKFNINIKNIVAPSILLMISYLILLNSDISFFADNRIALRLPFIAWFGYFTIAFVIGKHYQKVVEISSRFKWLILLFLAFSIGFNWINYTGGYTVLASRRWDLLPLVVSIFFVLITFGRSIPNNRIINIISNYSLGIYLIHWPVQLLISPHIARITDSNIGNIIIMFLTSLSIAMAIIYFVSKLPFGAFLVGQTKRKYKTNKSISQI